MKNYKLKPYEMMQEPKERSNRLFQVFLVFAILTAITIICFTYTITRPVYFNLEGDCTVKEWKEPPPGTWIGEPNHTIALYPDFVNCDFKAAGGIAVSQLAYLVATNE